MQKLYSELIGLRVYDEYSSSAHAYVQDLIVDSENGKILAFLLNNKHVVVPFDIERLTSGGLFVSDASRIVPLSEVVRVAKVHSRGIGIIGAKVITEKGKEYLGRVVDYEIDPMQMVLTRIHVARLILFFRAKERIISMNSVIRITKDTVVVRENRELRIQEKVAAQSSAFA